MTDDEFEAQLQAELRAAIKERFAGQTGSIETLRKFVTSWFAEKVKAKVLTGMPRFRLVRDPTDPRRLLIVGVDLN